MEDIQTSPSWKKNAFLTSIAVFLSLLVYFLLPNFLSESQRRVIAVIVFAIFFWGFEIIPLYATALLIVILLTFLLTSPIDILGVGSLSLQLFMAPFASPVMMLFLGGLVLAEALHKHQVDVFLIKKMLSKLGDHPYTILLGVLSISAFFSFWISNTAAAVIMLMLIMPVVGPLKAEDPFKKALLIAIAYGANIGGMGTPIASPPNAIAVGILREYGIELDFIHWMMMAIPLVILLIFMVSGVLYLFFPPQRKRISLLSLHETTLSGKGVGVLSLTVLIILFWVTKPIHNIPESLISLSGVGLFASFGLISVKEIRTLPWDVLILIWGGLALGEAVQRSDLVNQLLTHYPLFSQNSILFIIALSFFVLILSSFISNTATANLLLPIALSIDSENKMLFTVTIALACSFSFAFPFSTPPNALAYSTGTFTLKEMFKAGGLISLFSWLILLMGFQYIIPWVFEK